VGERGEPPTPHVLRELAFVADGERGAVIGPSGAVEWLCFPGWADPSVFSTLVGGDGWFSVRPAGRYVWGGHYEEGTLIWRSHWVLAGGAMVECREALALPAEPGRAVLLRRIEGLVGETTVEMILDLRPRYGTAPIRSWHRDGGVFTASTHGVHVRLRGAPRARDEADGHGGRQLVTTISLSEGEHHDLVLELADAPFDSSPPAPDKAWEQTRSRWARDLPEVEVAVARRDARHACAVLHGLTAASGAMVAAATTSLPEHADAGRNYDYRYAWMRDMALAGQAVCAAAPDAAVLDRWISFLVDRVLEDGPDLSPAYTSTGDRIPRPSKLGLEGYPGGTDVIGNQVRDQFQLDALGEVLLTLASAARLDRLDGQGWRAATTAADAIAARWKEPDSGFWELDPKWWAQSRLSCVAGLRAVSAVGAPASLVGGWQALADAMLAETTATCTHESGRLQRAPDDARVDTALLFPLIRGALPVADPRVSATIDAVRDELTVDGYVYRYRVDERPLGKAEGAFLLCGFVMSLAELLEGNVVASARWFERTRSGCGPPGIFSEEYDVDQRQLRGNLPQAFVHAVLLEAAAAQQPDPSK
jgi:GH15 family glucan-1,4-alpha-glucosidase